MRDNLRDTFVMSLALVPKHPFYHISQSSISRDHYALGSEKLLT